MLVVRPLVVRPFDATQRSLVDSELFARGLETAHRQRRQTLHRRRRQDVVRQRHAMGDCFDEAAYGLDFVRCELKVKNKRIDFARPKLSRPVRRDECVGIDTKVSPCRLI